MKGRFYEIPEERWLRDGVYIFSEEDNIEILSVEESVMDLEQSPEVDSFLEKYPDWVVASAYETNHTIFLSKRPSTYSGITFGSGFNYGSTNLLAGLPASTNYVLILAQND